MVWLTVSHSNGPHQKRKFIQSIVECLCDRASIPLHPAAAPLQSPLPVPWSERRRGDIGLGRVLDYLGPVIASRRHSSKFLAMVGRCSLIHHRRQGLCGSRKKTREKRLSFAGTREGDQRKTSSPVIVARCPRVVDLNHHFSGGWPQPAF
jgi:hypothetical protein